MQVLAAAADALGASGDGPGSGGVVRWGAAWAGGEELSSPAEELILSMHSTHAQAGPPLLVCGGEP